MLKDFKMLEMIYSGLSIIVLLFLLLLETLRKGDVKAPKELQIIAKDFTNRLCVIWFVLSFVVLYQITFY